MHHSSHRKIIALAAMLAGAVAAAPSSLSDIPKTSIVAEIKTGEMLEGIFVRLAADARAALRDAGIAYKSVKPTTSGVKGEIAEAAVSEKARDILTSLARSGGSVFTLEQSGQVFTLTLSEPTSAKLIDQAAEQSLKVLKHRLDDLKISTASVERQDRDHLLIELPKKANADNVIKAIGRTGLFTFQVACDEQPQAPADNPPEDCASYAMKDLADQKLWVMMTTAATVEGNDIEEASANVDSSLNIPVVSFKFNQEGAERLARLTSANVGRSVALILDELVISAPRIVEPILGGSGQISGNLTKDDADSLVLVLRSGSLPAPIKFISMTTEQDP